MSGDAQHALVPSPGLRQLAGTTLLYGAGQAATRFLSVLLLPVFTRYLTPVDFGIIGMLALLGFFAVPVFSLGIGGAIAPSYFQEGAERKAATVWTAVALVAGSCLVLLSIGIILADSVSDVAFGTRAHADLVRLTVISSVFTILATPLTLFLQFERRATQFLWLSVGVSVFTLLATVVLVVVAGRGVRGWVEGTAAGQLASLCAFAVPATRALRIRLSRELAGELLRLGVPLVPGFALVFVLQHGSRYVLQWFGGLDAVGVYTVGFNLGMGMAIAVSGFSTAWTPHFMAYQSRQDQAGEAFGRTLTYYVLGAGLLTLAFFVAARAVVMLLTAPEFHRAYLVVGLTAASQFFFGLFAVLLPGVYFAREIKVVSGVQAAAAVLAVALNYLLVPFGIAGAAAAMVLGTAAMAALQHVWNCYRAADYFRLVIEWRRLGVATSVYAAVAVLYLWPRAVTLPLELLFAAAGLGLLPALAYALLLPGERMQLRFLVSAARTARPPSPERLPSEQP